MTNLGKLVRVRQAMIVEGRIVLVEFEDGSVRQIDLTPLMHGPVFDELVENPDMFRQVTVSGGILSWPNGADIDPDVLYYGLTPASVSEINQVH